VQVQVQVRALVLVRVLVQVQVQGMGVPEFLVPVPGLEWVLEWVLGVQLVCNKVNQIVIRRTLTRKRRDVPCMR